MPTSPDLAATRRKHRVHRQPVARDLTQLALWLLLLVTETASLTARNTGHGPLGWALLAVSVGVLAAILGRLLGAGRDQT